MKKIIAIIICLMLMVGLVGCGDTNNNYKYAIVKLPNGEVVEGEIESYWSYSYQQLRIKFKGGNTYLTCSINAVLMVDVPIEVNE